MGSVARDAPLRADSAALPVLLVSHGTGGSARDIGWLGRRLAAAGFAVMGVDHHGNTINEEYRPEGFLCWWERPRDLSVVLDILSRTDPFSGRLDLDRVFAAGFSLGGHTVLSLLGGITEMEKFLRWADGTPGGRGPREFPNLADEVTPLFERSGVFRESWDRHAQSCHDSRVKAAVTLAPASPIRGFTTESLAAIRAPVAIAVGGADTEAPPGPCARWLHDQLADCRLYELGPTVGHYVFLCEATESGRACEPDICRDAPGVERRAIHDRIARATLDLAIAVQLN